MNPLQRLGLYLPEFALVRRFKRLLIGRPKRTEQAEHERLGVWAGLAVFFSDPLSSVAYGPEEILYVLVVAGVAATAFSLPIGIAIIALVFVVSSSYTQTIRAYPRGGGAYTVAKENLGEKAGLVAAGALLIDYTLTVTVSIAAGVAAVVSAFPEVRGYETEIGVAVVLVMAWINLHGVRESGTLFAAPTIAFMVVMLTLVGFGIARVALGGWNPVANVNQAFDFRGVPLWSSAGSLSFLLLLRAFASGTATLTGLEALSNGVRAFKQPESTNAAKAMAIGAVMLAVLAAGVLFLAFAYGLTPVPNETLISQVARSVFGTNLAYYIVQIATVLILFLAANTAFNGFPRLLGLLAQDGYVTHRLANFSDRLVYGSGIALLTLAAALVLIVVGGSIHRLIPLYAIGVFTAFTLSQTGMVVHWLKEQRKTGHRQIVHIVVSGTGAFLCGLALCIIAFTKFSHGAWTVVLMVPVLVAYFMYVKSYYRRLDDRLREIHDHPPQQKIGSKLKVFVTVDGVGPEVVHAANVARRLSRDITAIHVATDPERGAKVRKDWEKDGPRDVPLVVLDSPYRDIVTPLQRVLDRLQEKNPDTLVNVLLPIVVTNDPLDRHLRNTTSSRMLRDLVYNEAVMVTVVPFFVNMAEPQQREEPDEDGKRDPNEAYEIAKYAPPNIP